MVDNLKDKFDFTKKKEIDQTKEEDLRKIFRKAVKKVEKNLAEILESIRISNGQFRKEQDILTASPEKKKPHVVDIGNN